MRSGAGCTKQELAPKVCSCSMFSNQREVATYDALCAAVSDCSAGLLGCGVIRRYGFGALQPPGNFSFAASSDNDGTMITSSPSFQFTGGATLCFEVNCNESITRRISSK